MSAPRGRGLYARVAAGYIPRILALVDRSPLSATYGCFDKSYWHYRTMDFPSGMYQECVLPLALVYKHEVPGAEEYHGSPRVLELVRAGIGFAARSSHADGSTDDYYPYERALGASCFSLYACTESVIELGLEVDSDTAEFFTRRAEWLLRHQETGRLSNHQALCALCLHNVYTITGDERFLEGARRRLGITLDWQHDEGWFQEYEGADPGYQTFTIFYLAKYMQRTGDSTLLAPLERAVEFASYFLHPDGSYGGEYGSRNTYNFYPCGFELLVPHLALASSVADGFLYGLANGRRAYIDDERVFFHFAGNFLEAYIACGGREAMGAPMPREDFERHFEGAGLYVGQWDGVYAVVSLAKGGVFKCFLPTGEVVTDTGLAARLVDGSTVVSHLEGGTESTVEPGRVTAEGRFCYSKARLATPLRTVALRLFMLTVGWLAPNLVRGLLQRLLITHRKPAPLRFRRTLSFGDGVRVVDEVRTMAGCPGVEALYAGTDQTSIYVAMSGQYQLSQLRPWQDLGGHVDELNGEGRAVVTRVLGGEGS